MTTDEQVRKLMEELSKHGKLGIAAMRAGMHRNTARKYVKAGKLPTELSAPRSWRTRDDPFEDDWEEMAEKLKSAPELDAKTLFDFLLGTNPKRYEPGQLRTFQRRVKEWRAKEGPEKRVFFAQEHRPGEALQTDFTWATELGITIAGEAFPHMLCHVVLPYSNWEWVTVCHSESLLAIRRGVQAAVFRLGRIPTWCQTDHSTAATHVLGKADKEAGKTRGFNDSYVSFITHLGMKPRTTAPGEKEQNGDVEALNGAFKHRLEQHLLMRGSRDFESVEAYEAWLWGVLDKVNRLRGKRFIEEMAAMRELCVARLPEYVEERFKVSAWSTIRVKINTYSVPSRLIGEFVRVRIYEDRVAVYYGGQHQLTVERLSGRNGARVEYRHIIASLVKKPGAFARYKYREELFPTLTFRRAYDALEGVQAGIRADVEYLRILHLAATTMESEVELALSLLLDEGILRESGQVKALVTVKEAPLAVDMAVPSVDLASYDGLFFAAPRMLS